MAELEQAPWLTPEASEHPPAPWLEQKPKETFLGNLTGMATDIPGEIYDIAKPAMRKIGATFNPWSPENIASIEKQKQAAKEGFIPYLKAQHEAASNLGSGLMAPVELAASPVQGAARSVIGHGLAMAPGATYEDAKQKADLATMAFMPGRGLPHSPTVPIPPRPAPPLNRFGVTLSEGQETGDLAKIQTEQTALRGKDAPGFEHAQEFAAQQAPQLEQAQENVVRSADPYGQRIVSGPQEAGELVGSTIRTEAARAKAGVDAAYEAARAAPGEIHAAAFGGIGQRIKGDLTLGNNPVIIDDLTPHASAAIDYLDSQIANLRIKNKADPFGQPNQQNIVGVDLKGIDQWRKNLSERTSRAYQSGNLADGRATRAVLDAFDDRVHAAVNSNLYTGGPQAVQAWNDARSAYSQYRKTFTGNKGDEVGNVIEKITGKKQNAPLTGNDVIDALVGTSGTNASTKVVSTANRVKGILGPDSTEWHGVRQGLLVRLTEGQTPAVASKKINQFLNEGGVELSRVMFSPAERGMLQSYADMLDQLKVPQTGANWPNTAPPVVQAITTAAKKLTTAVGVAIGGILGHKLGIPYGMEGGMAAGAAMAKGVNKLAQVTQVRQIEKQMPVIARQLQQWQKAVAKASRANNQTPGAVAFATANLSRSLQKLGINPQSVLSAAGQEQQQAPGPGEQRKYGGKVNRKQRVETILRRYGGRVGFDDGGGLDPYVPPEDQTVIPETPGAIPGGRGRPARVLVQPGRPEGLEDVPGAAVDASPPLTPRLPPGTTPQDVGNYLSTLPKEIAKYAAPHLYSLLFNTEEEKPPLENLPEYGKTPQVDVDPRFAESMPEMASIATSLAGPPTKAAVPFAARALGWTGQASKMLREANHLDFHAAISAAKDIHPNGAAVTLYSPEEYQGMKTFLAPDHSAGFAVKPNGDIVSVFKNPTSKHPDIAKAALNTAVENGGTHLDAFDTVLPHLYGDNGFRAVARIPFDPQFAPPGWDAAKFAKYNGGKPDVVFMVHDPYNPGYKPGDGQLVNSYEEAVALQQQEVNKISARKQESLDSFNDLSSQITGLKSTGKYLTPSELEMTTRRFGQSLSDIFTQMPSSEEMAAIAYSGRAKRGWYKQSAQALVDVFGTQDAPRFAALLAALSPQTSVESNAANTLQMWANWVKAGRPTKASEISEVLGRSVLGDKGEESVLEAWRGNVIRALQSKDPSKVLISGPKVNSFMHNLRGHVDEVTNDAWMANYANIDQGLFASRRRVTDPNPPQGFVPKPRAGKEPNPNYRPTIGLKSPGYVAMSAKVRQAADILSERTGDTWTPAEIQETIWSWAKTIYEKAYKRKKGVPFNPDETVEKLLRAGNLTHEEIANTPDFALLFTRGIYRQILEEAGYGKRLETTARKTLERSSVAPSGTPLTREGTTFARPAFRKHLQRAAKRLDKRKASGLADVEEE